MAPAAMRKRRLVMRDQIRRGRVARRRVALLRVERKVVDLS
jgi:hypothetical protein